MSIRNLDKLFQPRSVAIIGASNREQSVARVLSRNLLGGAGSWGALSAMSIHGG